MMRHRMTTRRLMMAVALSALLLWSAILAAARTACRCHDPAHHRLAYIIAGW